MAMWRSGSGSAVGGTCPQHGGRRLAAWRTACMTWAGASRDDASARPALASDDRRQRRPQRVVGDVASEMLSAVAGSGIPRARRGHIRRTEQSDQGLAMAIGAGASTTDAGRAAATVATAAVGRCMLACIGPSLRCEAPAVVLTDCAHHRPGPLQGQEQQEADDDDPAHGCRSVASTRVYHYIRARMAATESSKFAVTQGLRPGPARKRAADSLGRALVAALYMTCNPRNRKATSRRLL